MAQRVWRLSVSVFVHDGYSHAGNCIGLLSNTGLFLSTGNKYLLFPSTPLSPFRFLTTTPVSIFPCLASKFRNRSFQSSLLFTVVLIFWELGIDNYWCISMPYNSNAVLSWSDSRVLNLYRLSRTSSDGLFDISSKFFIPSCIESWTLHAEWQRINRRSPILNHERQ